MTTPNAFNVRQRGYELITPTDVQNRLVTRNVSLCTVFIGVNKKEGLAFMCHLDMPTTVNALRELVALIRKEHGSLTDFELYAVSRFPPRIRLLWILLSSWIAYALAQAIAGFAIAAACVVFIAWLLAWAQLKCYWIAHNYFHARIQWRSPEKRAKTSRTLGVVTGTTVPKVVDVWWDEEGIDMTPWRPRPCQLKASRARDDPRKEKP